jgi:hypothetical protein
LSRRPGEIHQAAIPVSAGHGQGWSPEWRVGLQGIGSWVKQWQAGLEQPPGQLHSEQRIRHPGRTGPVWQQNHSPLVLQPSGQPPPDAQLLQVKPKSSQIVAGE